MHTSTMPSSSITLTVLSMVKLAAKGKRTIMARWVSKLRKSRTVTVLDDHNGLVGLYGEGSIVCLGGWETDGEYEIFIALNKVIADDGDCYTGSTAIGIIPLGWAEGQLHST